MTQPGGAGFDPRSLYGRMLAAPLSSSGKGPQKVVIDVNLRFPGGRDAAERRVRGPTIGVSTGTGALPHDIGGEPAGLKIQGVTVEITQHPTEGPFTGHHEPAPQRVPPRTQPGQEILRGTYRPLPDRGHRVVAHHQRRPLRQRQDHHQLMATPSPLPPVDHLTQPREKRRRTHRR